MYSWGRDSSMYLSCSPGFESQALHLRFCSQVYYYTSHCIEKRTKINKKMPGQAHVLKCYRRQLNYSCISLSRARAKNVLKFEIVKKSFFFEEVMKVNQQQPLPFPECIPPVENFAFSVKNLNFQQIFILCIDSHSLSSSCR